MQKHVNTIPHPDAIDMKDLVVDAPTQATKSGGHIPKHVLKKITAPIPEQSAP